MSQFPNIWAVVPAAGAGRRMGSEIPKQYLTIAGRSVLEITLHKLARLSLAGICVALAADDDRFATEVTPPENTHVLLGGAERADSVLNALNWLMTRGCADDWALVHDAARPCVRVENIQALIAQALPSRRGGLLAVPVADTLKRQSGDAVATVDRSNLWHAHTPQLFPVGLLHQALHRAKAHGLAVTDEASAVEMLGFHPLLVTDSRDNIKITRPEDLALAAFILDRQV